MSQTGFAVALVFCFIHVANTKSTWNITCGDNPRYVSIPVSKESDFGSGMNRDWIEGYYTNRNSYFRLYMAVYDEVNYPDYKDIWQDKSGNIVISGKGKFLWIGFGRPARQIAFAEKYLNQGGTNRPLIRSFLIEASTITELSRRAVEEKYRSRGLDLNVDVTQSPNQFGLSVESMELLRQNALSHSLVTYYLVQGTPKPDWGLVEHVNVLTVRVQNGNLNRLIQDKPLYWFTEELFPIQDDILDHGNRFDYNAAAIQSANYKTVLVKRKVLLTLIAEVMIFYTRGGKPYNVLKTQFEKYVVKNKRILEKFRLGEDVTRLDVDAIEKSLLDNMNKGTPSKPADVDLWKRFKASVDQVRGFVSYSGTEVKVGDPNLIITDWNVFHNYHTFAVRYLTDKIELMQLAQDTTNIGIRMAWGNPVPVEALCAFIKRNFMGNRVDNLQLISPLTDSKALFIYAKTVADCIERDDGTYLSKALNATLVTVFGHDYNEYRFYPDSQVGWSIAEKGTLLLFRHGNAVNLRIRGVVRQIGDILLPTLARENPKLQEEINNLINHQRDGFVIVPQKFVKWPKVSDFEGGSFDDGLFDRIDRDLEELLFFKQS